MALPKNPDPDPTAKPSSDQPSSMGGPSGGTGVSASGDAPAAASDDAQAKQVKKQSHAEGLAVALDNAGKEVDALISQVAGGTPATGAQLTQLKTMLQGMHAVSQGIASGTMT